VFQTRSNCMTVVSSDNLLPKVRRVCRLRGLRERRWSADCTEIAIAAQAKSPGRIQADGGAGTGVYAAMLARGAQWQLHWTQQTFDATASVAQSIMAQDETFALCLCGSKPDYSAMGMSSLGPVPSHNTLLSGSIIFISYAHGRLVGS
jgi:hypothetical protein